MILLVIGALISLAQGQGLEQGIQDKACNATTRPVVLNANEPWVMGPFDYTYENRTYSPNMLCEWKVHMDSPDWDQVLLNWLAFDVQDCTDCKCDSVSVYDGPDDQSPLMGTYCGHTAPAHLTSTSGEMFVRWVTDDSYEYEGFMARYGYPLQLTACTSSRPEVIERPLFSGGIFYSQNYPENYPNNANCQWIFTAANDTGRIRVTILDFETDELCQPGLDRLDLYDDVDMNTRLIRHTGRIDYQPAMIESSGPVMLAHFNSDPMFNFRGFFAIWDVVPHDHEGNKDDI